MSTYYNLLNAVASVVSGLTMPAAVRKLPAAEEAVDTLPLVCVVPQDRPEDVNPYAFGFTEVVYHVAVAVIRAGQHSLTTGLDVALDWRDRIIGAFNQPRHPTVAAAVPSLYDTRITPEMPVDRAALNLNYDYAVVGLDFRTTRPLGS